MILGASGDDEFVYSESEVKDIFDNPLTTDDDKQSSITDILATNSKVLDSYIKEVANLTNNGGALFAGSGVTDFNADRPNGTLDLGNASGGEASQSVVANVGKSAIAWDPRIIRVDAFLSKSTGGIAVVPFSSDTAASAYYNQLFNIEVAVANEVGKDGGGGGTSTGGNGSSSGRVSSSNLSGSDKTAPNTTQVNMLKKDPNEFGTLSLMNPYCVTTLVGSLSGSPESGFSTHLYDIRDSKRFYEGGSNGSGYTIEQINDIVSINNPTISNIVKCSNKDKWGRTPYSFQDFAFCKWWNIIPNNRLITFRKYAVPTFDNLNFPGMVNDEGDPDTEKVIAPIATVVTYFGGDSANKLEDFLKFSTGTKWKDIQAELHKVQGDTGDNPRARIDEMFERGGSFGGQGSASRIVNSILSDSGFLTGQFLSFGKFLGLLDPNGYNGHS